MSIRYHRGFTLVEMLVVIGIIAVLAALLLPAVMTTITRARNTVIALELKQLDTAIEAYRLEKGDYPPNFRDRDVVRRHVMKCYPKIDRGYFDAFLAQATKIVPPGAPPDLFIDEGESLVFWLSMTDTDPRYPFLSYFNPSPSANTPKPKKYYDFDQTRLQRDSSEDQTVANVGTYYDVPSFVAKFCQDTNYIYIDSRSYTALTVDFSASPPTRPVYAYSEDSTVGVRPYWSDTRNTANVSSTYNRDRFKAANETTFQIICAGQDGDFGGLATDVKFFPSGTRYDDGDKDNITSFSNGSTLANRIP
jgi:prepilin-type N-terminal cleavage/methylation domain-containing protein